MPVASVPSIKSYIHQKLIKMRADHRGHEGDLERLGGHVLQDEISVGGEEGRVMVAGVGVGPAEANEHA